MPLRRKRLTPAERVRKLVDAACESRNRDPATMLRLSGAAVALAEEKIAELPGDLVVAAWTHYGNAHRIAGRYEVAEQALHRAAELTTSATATKVTLLEVTANLHRNTGRYESAVRLLTSAIDEQKSLGDSNGEARSLNLLGLTYLDSGEPQRALCAFQSALGLLGAGAPPDVMASTGHSLLKALIQAGRLSAAAAALEILEPYYRRLTSARLAARCEWVRARLWRKLQAVQRRPACLRTSLCDLAHRTAIPRVLATEAQATVPPLPFGVGGGGRTGEGARGRGFRASPLSRRRTGRWVRGPGGAAYAVLRPRSCSSRSSRLSVSL